MKKLSQIKCIACTEDVPKLSFAQAQQLLITHQLNSWQIENKNQILLLSKDFKFDNFAQTLSFANKVGQLAQNQGHHPELIISWGLLTVRWWSHKIKGLHLNDFICAAKTDALIE